MGLFNLQKRKLRGGLVTLYNCFKGDWSKVGVDLISYVISSRIGGNGLRLCPGRFSLCIRKKYFPEGFKPWIRLPQGGGKVSVPGCI